MQDKSHFIENIIIIGLKRYNKDQEFFERMKLNNIDLSKINF